MSLAFHISKRCPETEARLGELVTPHGTVPTPVFVPVGSQATVKALAPDDLRTLGYPMLMTNAYHLYLRPGVEVISRAGGLHRFMGWERALMTDSGGYQLFSLAQLSIVSDEGITFRSHIDGSQHFITPELAVQYQETLGADIIMVLDECLAHDAVYARVREAMERTHRWAERCLAARKRSDQSLFAIVQGGVFPELRRESATFLAARDFLGYAIGGLSLGEPKATTQEIVAATVTYLPKDKPRHLLGVGSPEDIIAGVAQGIDLFDCAMPTQIARKGALFTWQGRRNIRNAIYREMTEPFDPGCGCYSCRSFSASYLHHLFRSQELLAYRLATIHNLYFMNALMNKIAKAIQSGTFRTFHDSFLAAYETSDDETRAAQREKWLAAQMRKGLTDKETE